MTSYYDTSNTPDYSQYAVHFTRSRTMIAEQLLSPEHPLSAFKKVTAFEKLKNILREKKILGSPMPFLPNSPNAVCFTECIWDALVGLTDRYSPFGLVFSKRLIYSKGGGPALYIRGDTLKALGNTIPPQLEPMISPFDPDGVLKPGTILDYLHEREWRLPGDLTFEDADVEYLIVESLSDALAIIEAFGNERFPKGRILVMEMYRTIREAWGPG